MTVSIHFDSAGRFMEIFKRGHIVLQNGAMPQMRRTELYASPEKRSAMMARLIDSAGVSHDEAEEHLSRKLNEEVWSNGVYTCIVDRSGEFVHLSIRRVDRGYAKDWRHFQQIKNDILGEEAEAVELFPAESRLVDTANQFHLWCKLPGQRFEFGFDERIVQSESDQSSGFRQRPRSDA